MKQKWIWGSVALVGIAALIGAYLTRDQQKSININAVGSTALQPMVEAAGEDFQRKNPGVYINVQGGGSGTGLAQIQSGAVDLGNADMFAEEKKGIKSKQLTDHQVAVIGIAPIINKEAKIKNLTTQQMIDIFTKKTTNWKDVGGADQPIILVNRVNGSGTRVTFERYGLDKTSSSEGQEQDSSGTARSIVSSTPGAISYVAFSYIDKKQIDVPKLNGVTPNDTNVTNGKYPIWSYEHIYTKGEIKPEVSQFIDYLKSKQIQKTLIPKLGYISIHDMKIQRDVSGVVTPVK